MAYPCHTRVFVVAHSISLAALIVSTNGSVTLYEIFSTSVVSLWLCDRVRGTSCCFGGRKRNVDILYFENSIYWGASPRWCGCVALKLGELLRMIARTHARVRIGIYETNSEFQHRRWWCCDSVLVGGWMHPGWCCGEVAGGREWRRRSVIFVVVMMSQWTTFGNDW